MINNCTWNFDIPVPDQFGNFRHDKTEYETSFQSSIIDAEVPTISKSSPNFRNSWGSTLLQVKSIFLGAVFENFILHELQPDDATHWPVTLLGVVVEMDSTISTSQRHLVELGVPQTPHHTLVTHTSQKIHSNTASQTDDTHINVDHMQRHLTTLWGHTHHRKYTATLHHKLMIHTS